MSDDVQDDYPLLNSAAQLGINIERKREVVVVPEWKQRVILQEFNGAQLDRYRSAMTKFDARTQEIDLDMTGSTLRLVVLCMIDSSGHPIYKDVEKGVDLLGKLPASGLERVAEVAKKLNGMGGGDTDETLVGKSEEAPGTDSSVDSVSL